jgi:hypothetical protein
MPHDMSANQGDTDQRATHKQNVLKVAIFKNNSKIK